MFQRRTQRSRRPLQITDSYLQHVVDDYLQKHFTSRAHLRTLLMKRVQRAQKENPEFNREEATQKVDSLLERLVEQGVLNDARYAASKVRGLVRRGTAPRAIGAKLAVKGVASSLVQAGLEEFKEEEGDPLRTAALAWIRRKKAGAWRQDPQRQAMQQKDLAAMARAGFPYGLCRELLEASLEELQAG